MVGREWGEPTSPTQSHQHRRGAPMPWGAGNVSAVQALPLPPRCQHSPPTSIQPLLPSARPTLCPQGCHQLSKGRMASKLPPAQPPQLWRLSPPHGCSGMGLGWEHGHMGQADHSTHQHPSLLSCPSSLLTATSPASPATRLLLNLQNTIAHLTMSPPGDPGGRLKCHTGPSAPGQRGTYPHPCACTLPSWRGRPQREGRASRQG